MDAGERSRDGLKICTKCKEFKSKDSFCRNSQIKSGLHSWCKKCLVFKNKEWADKNKDRVIEYRKKKHLQNPVMRRNQMCMWTYGISSVEYDAFVSSRKGLCDCCGGCMKKPNLDHDHVTGKIRGVLCNRCNTGIGKLGDNSTGVRRALEYLLKSE